jgi:hypothetical protein
LLNVSIGRLRSAMGVFAVVAHLPFLGQIAKAASYAPNTVSTAAGMTTTGATAGVSVLALSGSLAIASTASAAPDLPRTVPSAFEESDRAQMILEPAIVVLPATSAPSTTVAAPASTSHGGAQPVSVASASPIAATTVPPPDEAIAPVDPAPAPPAELVAFDSPPPVDVTPVVAPSPVAKPAAAVTPAIAASPKPATNSGGGDSGKGASSGKSGKGTKEDADEKHGGSDKGESDNEGKNGDKKGKSGKNG